MRYALMLEPQQGMSYDDQLASAKRAEANGFDAFFRADHFASFPGEAGQPTTDAWSVLAGLARETKRIELGVLVSPVTFRHPGVFAKVVTTVDEMSGGRIEVGVGCRLERPGAPPARPAVPTDRAARRPARGPAGHPARVVGRAGWLVVRRDQRHPGARRAVPAASCRGRKADPRRRSAASVPASSWAAGGRRGRTGSRPATQTSSTSARRHRPAPPRCARSSTRRAGRSVGIRRRSPDPRWPACWSGAPRTR